MGNLTHGVLYFLRYTLPVSNAYVSLPSLECDMVFKKKMVKTVNH